MEGNVLKLIFLAVNVYILSLHLNTFIFPAAWRLEFTDVPTKRNEIFIFLKLLCLKWFVYFYFGNDFFHNYVCDHMIFFLSFHTIYMLCVVSFLNDLAISSYTRFWRTKILYLFAPSRVSSWLRPLDACSIFGILWWGTLAYSWRP